MYLTDVRGLALGAVTLSEGIPEIEGAVSAMIKVCLVQCLESA
jgi:hypothetical protein